MEINEIYVKPLAILKILSKLDDKETLEEIVGTEEKTTRFSAFKKSVKEQIFKTVGYHFGIKKEVRLNKDKVGIMDLPLNFYKDKVGTMSMTPSQFLFISSEGKKVYGALPKDLTKALLLYKRETSTIDSNASFAPEISCISKDGDALLMNISSWNWTKFFAPHNNYANIIVKIENGKMSFADFIRYSVNNRGDICKLKKSIINYGEKVFFGNNDYLQKVIYHHRFKFNK